MKLFQSLIHTIFQKETSLLAFIGKWLCRNSAFFYLGVSLDLFFTYYLFTSVFPSIGKDMNAYGFPIWTALMWFLNFIISLVQFYRHFSAFSRNIIYYLLLIAFIIPHSCMIFFYLAFLPFWMIPCLMKLLK